MPDPEAIESISSASEARGGDLTPDAKAKREAEEIENEKQRESLHGQRNDNRARVVYARSIFRLISIWLAAIFLLLLLQGFLGRDGTPYDWSISGPYGPRATGVVHFDLPAEVVLALIGGTTASVLGIFTFVAKYLFPEKK